MSNAMNEALLALTVARSCLFYENSSEAIENINLAIKTLEREYCVECGLPDNCGDCTHDLG